MVMTFPKSIPGAGGAGGGLPGMSGIPGFTGGDAGPAFSEATGTFYGGDTEPFMSSAFIVGGTGNSISDLKSNWSTWLFIAGVFLFLWKIKK